MVREIEAAAQSIRVPGPRLGRRKGFAHTRRTQFVATVYKYGLRDVVSESILDHVVDARDAASGSERADLESTIAALRTARGAAEEARTALIEANIGLVVWVANKRKNNGLPLSDLIQEGTLGLMRAVEKFDHRRGLRFNTYAIWWVRHSVNRALSDQSRTIRIPVHQLETRLKVAGVARSFVHEHGRDPTDAELARAAGVPVSKVRTLATMPKEPLSMDLPQTDEGELRLGDLIAEPGNTSALDELSRRELERRLRALLGRLSSRDAEVLKLRFGIDRPDCLTLNEIGERLSLSRERIRQIEVEALAKLRGPAAAEDLRSLLVS
jgi:RNA polymerase primary sigma factor